MGVGAGGAKTLEEEWFAISPFENVLSKQMYHLEAMPLKFLQRLCCNDPYSQHMTFSAVLFKRYCHPFMCSHCKKVPLSSAASVCIDL